MMIADLAILSTRLPYVDRGTLSQAWYDALHMAHSKPQCTAQSALHSPCAPAVHAKVTPQRSAARGGLSPNTSPSVRVGRVSPRPEPALGVHPAPRTRPTCSPQTIGKTQPTPKCVPLQTATVIQLPHGERVCFLVSRSRQGVRLIAVCAPHLRTRVEQALVDTRRLLALQGVPCHVALQGEAA